MNETDSEEYSVRTELNVLHSDGTLVLYNTTLDEGTHLTNELAERYSKPILLVDLSEEYDISKIKKWIERNKISIFNIAGSRESKSPGIYYLTKKLLHQLL